MNNKIILNKYGYYELKNKLTQKQLEKYYEKQYYQEENKYYSKSYTKEELLYFINKIKQKYYMIKDKLNNKENKLLDIGCGEGFTLSFFKKMKWDITGLDFSKYAIETMNPNCLKNAIIGDVYKNIKELIKLKKKYNVIWIGNTLEHVLNPIKLLKQCYKLADKKCFLVICVPNDNSVIQYKIKELQKIKNNFWVFSPDHISYFNRKGLENICNKAEWNTYKIISDFPIDFNLFNSNSNYITDKKKGKEAHKQRLILENLFHSISIEKTNKLYESLANMGLGRQIIGIFKK